MIDVSLGWANLLPSEQIVIKLLNLEANRTFKAEIDALVDDEELPEFDLDMFDYVGDLFIHDSVPSMVLKTLGKIVLFIVKTSYIR